MLKQIAFVTLIMTALLPVCAQNIVAPKTAQNVSNQLLALESEIESAVVRGDVAFLDTVYATDFRFTHGTGLVQNKAEWLTNVQRISYIERHLDSLEIEQHGDVALVTGRLHVRSHKGIGESRYGISYVRVYAIRGGRWQMLSHRSIHRWDLPTK
ncbi:MAG: nuclear transport factor 2 family protein [Ignavibacteriales bacterium]|nr:nuclear transport factor 2 family protein [Ignavibacteriales bacterium]